MRRKSMFRWDPGGKNPFERRREKKKKKDRKREKGLDRVELRSWMENAPRNIPGIVWEQFSKQPDDVGFPLRYKSAEVAGPQQTATALPRASPTLKKEPLTLRDYPQNKSRDRRLREGISKDSSEDRLYPLFTQLGTGFLLRTLKKFIQDADAYCCRYLPWEP